MRVVFLLILLYQQVHSYAISRNFKEFLNERYGEKIARSIYRPEIYRGSVGGNDHIPGEPTKRIPLIFIHGLGTKAGDYVSIQKVFKEAGYRLEEIYALTWGTPGSFFTGVHMECKHVIQIRRFIESVSEFTSSEVDIIAYSMGAPLARKAIMGGRCVDNEQIDLGPSLTERIHTFLSVGGANSGSHLCQTPSTIFCNSRTGLFCNSSFVRDINTKHFSINLWNLMPKGPDLCVTKINELGDPKSQSQKGNFGDTVFENERGYEGKEIFAIYNPQDEWIGDSSPCGTPSYTLSGAEYHIFPQSFHASILWRSTREQLALIMRKYELGDLLENIQKIRMRPIPSAITGNHVQENDVDEKALRDDIRRRRRRLQDRTTRAHSPEPRKQQEPKRIEPTIVTPSTRVSGEVSFGRGSYSPARTVRLVALQDNPIPRSPVPSPSPSSLINPNQVVLMAIQSSAHSRSNAKTFVSLS